MLADTDTLARLAYEAFYAALGAAHVTLPWTRQRPQVQQAWRVVVETVREGDDMQEETRG